MQVKAQSLALFAELPGRTAPYLIAEVRPQVSGIIQKRQFDEGGNVKAGTSLYQIDPSIYQADLESAKANLARAQATLTSAQLRNDRFQGLAAENAVSQQEKDDAFAAFKLAQAEVAAARAALRTAEINLAYTRVTAPIGGRIGRSMVTPGALVQQGQAQAMATIQQLDPMYVDLTQSTAELLQLRRDLESGQLTSNGKNAAKVRLLLEDGSQYPHSGELQFSDITVDQNTGTVTVRAVFPNPDNTLLPGMYVRAALEEGVQSDAIVVPQKAISRDNTGTPVALVVKEDNTVERRTVRTARAMGDQWLIAAGLNEGDKIIVEGIQRARPGQAVEPTLLETPPAQQAAKQSAQ